MTPVIRTYTGRLVNPLDLKPEDIHIRDIAHHLACFNRFCGALHKPVNVAAHSVLVYKLVSWNTEDTTLRLQALLHDATEAYLGDVTKWLKQSPAMAGYREAEERAHKVIMGRFGLPPSDPHEVQEADRVAVTFEGQRGFRDDGWPHFETKYPPLTPTEILAIGNHDPFMGWWEAKHLFLEEFNNLWSRYGEDEDVEGD